MNRQIKHLEARARVIKRLRRLGLGATEAARDARYDVLVNNRLRVALRVAYPGRYAHTVTVSGKRYAYDYESWSFNFHRHGRWDRRYCDVFICIAKHRRPLDEVFVIPALAISGPTFSLHGAGKPYRGRYAVFRDRWGVIGELLEAPAEPSAVNVA